MAHDVSRTYIADDDAKPRGVELAVTVQLVVDASTAVHVNEFII